MGIHRCPIDAIRLDVAPLAVLAARVQRHLGALTHQQHIGITRLSASTLVMPILHGVTIFQPCPARLPQRVKAAVDLLGHLGLRRSVQIGAITFQLLRESTYHLVGTQAMRLQIGATTYQRVLVLRRLRVLTPLEMPHHGAQIYQPPPAKTRHIVLGLLQVLAQRGLVIRAVLIPDGSPRPHGVQTFLLLQEATHRSALAQRVLPTVTIFQLRIEAMLLNVLGRATRSHLGATTFPQQVVQTRLIVQVLVPPLRLIGATPFQLRAVHTLPIASMRASVWPNGVTVFQLLIELSIRHVLEQELQPCRLKSRSWFAV